MNALRRKELNAILALIEQARDRLPIVKDEEEEYLLNIPFNFINRYKQGQKVVDILDEQLYALDGIFEEMEDALE